MNNAPHHFTEYDQYLFGHATHYDLYQKLGAHPGERDGEAGTWFAVWAPNARRVSVVGDFNGWNTESDVMTRLGGIGVWETFVPGVTNGALYKFFLTGIGGQPIYKADPYARYAELRPGTASIVWDEPFSWHDGDWMEKRKTADPEASPMIIYECHIGSWMKHPEWDGREKGFYTYREFAERIAEYLIEMNYTHVELLGIAEHPFDGSWGYQVSGYYAPTSRYGTPADFQYMVDYLHQKGIGVILDWVPAHFPKDEFGLANFDGCALYEHADPRQGEHPEWGTKIFNYGRPEVKNFLIANALYWIEYFHADGLRVDAVASMLYLNYGKEDGQWVANEYGGNENLEAIEFFRHLNSLVRGRDPGCVIMAEESTAWPGVTADPKDGGLGFSMKWNMGWMNDFLEYMKLDPYFRKFNHHKLTFSTSYCFSEKYVLVLSHDEVVHLKCSMWSKMPGIYEDKFSNLRAGYTYMAGHPGKKLLFMGQEFGQMREWSEERELDWYLLAEPLHKKLQDYVRDLWKLCRTYPALYATDSDWRGFEWINADDADRSIYSFVRKARIGEAQDTADAAPEQAAGIDAADRPACGSHRDRNLLFILNMTPMARPDYRVGVPEMTEYRLILNSMDPKYGGGAPIETEVFPAEESECDRRPYSFACPLPAYGCLVFEY